jgi:hypothetical protein
MSLDSWHLAGLENKKQKDFVEKYILEHFGHNPDDEVHAMSEGLKAYYDSLGLNFGNDDEDSFILPEE